MNEKGAAKMRKHITRRESLKRVGVISAAAATGIGLSDLLGCVGVEVNRGEGARTRSEDILSILQDYDTRAKDWDRIFGPDLLYWIEYGGRCDFKGHHYNPYGRKGPGVDYDVEFGTPLVPGARSFWPRIVERITGGLVLWLTEAVSRDYSIGYAHLYKALISKKNQESERGIPTFFERNVIVAFSGNSGMGPKDFGGTQPYHLHFGLYRRKLHLVSLKKEKYKGKWVDPEQYGPDKGKPIYWDLETDLDLVSTARLMELERTINGIPQELESWPHGDHDLDELKGNISEYQGRIGSVTRMEILDSAAFHDMRALLKDEILGKSKTTKYVPGTRPYSLMLKILGYSSIDQNFVLTLPFPSPDLVGLQLEGKLPENLKPYRLVS